MSAVGAAPVAFLDLAAERAALGPELEAAVLRVLRSGQYVLGPEVERFEHDFARFCGVSHAVAVSTGTEALVLGLRALGVEPGDAVLTSPFTFFASAGTIAWIGARPRFADVDLATGLLDVKAVERALDGSTRAIVPVHLYGQLADVRALRALADPRQVAVLEDGAQAHGAERDGARCGALGHAGTYSFYPTKNLGAAGEGGLVTTNDAAIATRLRELRDHGSPAKYRHAHVGTNARMQAFQGAVLNVKLPHLESWNQARRANAARYDEAFRGAQTVVPLERVPGTHVFHQYTVRIPSGERDALQAALATEGIATGVHYPLPVHLQEAARPWGHGPGDFPNAERLAREVLCLPIHPFLTPAEVDRVAEAVLRLAR
jgi:dTDP-4-amino-4,6-dideoxygalactose transaminase